MSATLAVIPSHHELATTADLPAITCDPCTNSNHPPGGDCDWIAALDTAGETHTLACCCETCAVEYNRRYWAAVGAL